LHDITERKVQEDALRKSEHQYRTLARNLPDTAVFMFDHDLRYLLVEGQFLEKAGYSRKMLENKTLYEVLPESMREALLPYYEAPLRGEQLTYERTTSQGFIYEATATPIYDEEQEIIGGLLVTHDVTESREREQELQKARDMAEAASRAKSIFLASMSHELRTPLNAILGFAQVLERDTRLNSQQHEQVQIIDRSGQHLLRLINQVLDISRIEAGQSQLQPVPTDLYQLVDEVSAMMEGIAHQKDLQFNALIRPGVPHYIVIDASKLRQILINLIGNAIKFTVEGEISLYVGADTSYLYCDVQDTGRGIPADVLPALFDLYGTPQPGSNYQPDGAGLGLPLSQSFARLMGGDLVLESQDGSGTTAHVTARYESASRTDVRVTQGASVVKLTASEEDYRILVAEDRAENRLLLLSLLEDVGYQVKVAHNGVEAVEIVESWEPHLVLMDMRMPVMDGYEATQKIKAQEDPPIVIALSASAFIQQQRQMYASGCDDIISKPFRAEEIYEKFAEHLQIEYEYLSSVSASPAPVRAIQPKNLVTLPDKLLNALYGAVVRLDTVAVIQIVDEIRSHDAEIGRTLRQMVDDFRYDRLRQLLQEYLNTE
ncbi:MAG: response regulator, partial [Aggregatilineales bacterium]